MFILINKSALIISLASRSCLSQASKLTLHPIDGAPSEELPALNSEQLKDIGNPDIIKNEIALLEDRCANMKPNLGAIAEFKKKVHAPVLILLFFYYSNAVIFGQVSE